MNIKKNYFLGLFVFMGGSIGFILLMNYLIPDVQKPKEGIPHNYWIPTKEDIQFQDSMWSIINKTQSEVDTIKKSTSPQSCNVTISDGKLILCSTNHEALKKFKSVMVKLGNKVQAYTVKRNDKNEEIHSYIFEMKTNK